MVMKGATNRDEIPPTSDWQGPMCWAGSPPRPVGVYSRPGPMGAVYVRAELNFTITEALGPGMTRQLEVATPGLIRLVRDKPVEVHGPGPDGQCWTYRRIKVGRRWRWEAFSGSTFPAADRRGSGPGPDGVERVLLQSILPLAGNRHLCFVIGPGGAEEDLAVMQDPDPDD